MRIPSIAIYCGRGSCRLTRYMTKIGPGAEVKDPTIPPIMPAKTLLIRFSGNLGSNVVIDSIANVTTNAPRIPSRREGGMSVASHTPSGVATAAAARIGAALRNATGMWPARQTCRQVRRHQNNAVDGECLFNRQEERHNGDCHERQAKADGALNDPANEKKPCAGNQNRRVEINGHCGYVCRPRTSHAGASARCKPVAGGSSSRGSRARPGRHGVSPLRNADGH